MSVDFSQWSESSSPSEYDTNFPWSILRTPADKILRLAVISAGHYGVYTHYHRGRTIPHLKTECEGCSENALPRWYGYVLALLNPTRQKVVFEFTAKSAETIIKAEKDYGTLRGLIIQASRPRGRDNSPVHLHVTGQQFNPTELPEPESIRPILAHIWGFKQTSPVAQEHQVLADAPEYQLAHARIKRGPHSVSEAILSPTGELRGVVESIGQLPADPPTKKVNGKR